MTPSSTNPGDEAPSPTPFKPRPRLFVVLCAALAVWLVALVVLYAMTVYPRRHPSPASTQHAPLIP